MKNNTENTPKHCHDCHAFADCRQAQNMMADTPPVEGWLIDGEVFCATCLDDDTYHYQPLSGEWDSPTHCENCGVPIKHELTQEGVDYVREALADTGCCQELWPTVWGIEPKIPVDSIRIPEEFMELCEDWYGGIGCMLYAVSSTGGLTLGTLRPEGCDTKEKWYLTLWRNLAADVYHTRRCAGDEKCYPEGHEDMPAICEFEEWVDNVIIRLEESYGLADWDA